MEQERFDIIVLGGGPAGYPAAIRAAELGQKVALVEAYQLGGTCLNRGCIPSKTLIATADILRKIKKSDSFGIATTGIAYDYPKIKKRKDQTVEKLRKGLETLILSNGITVIKGFGKFVSSKEIEVTGETKRIIQADKIIIATGSEPKNIPAFSCDHEKILDSTDLLNLTQLPKKLCIVGGGVIGSEFACLFKTFDVEVIILEMMPRILPTESEFISAELTKAFKRQGIKIETNVKVTSIEKTENGILVKLEKGESIAADLVLIAVGRELNTSKIALEKAGLSTLPSGIIEVNEEMETKVKGIYAVGDIASKWWLAHVGTHQGLVAGSNAGGKKATMHYNAIPSVIFTYPECASVGLSLEEALKKGLPAVLGSFPFAALGKSQANLEVEGSTQIILNEKTGEILGCQIVGYEASILIAEVTLAITNELTAECIEETIHAHPTLSEAIAEATLLATGKPLHLPKKKGAAL